MRKTALFVLVAASVSHAFQFPFDISRLGLTKPQTAPSPSAVPPRSPRVGIIGAGAGGSSAAFWIAKAKERYGLDVAVDIYERNDYIGGRKSVNSSV
jgi:prenylcysteine oxidase/farnesylcysteine lyase